MVQDTGPEDGAEPQGDVQMLTAGLFLQEMQHFYQQAVMPRAKDIEEVGRISIVQIPDHQWCLLGRLLAVIQVNNTGNVCKPFVQVLHSESELKPVFFSVVIPVCRHP